MVVAAGLLAAAFGLWLLAGWMQRRTGLPYARVRYDDASAQRVEKALVSHRYRLTGKPDFLLEQRGALIPVEVKPLRRAAEPYEGDLMQLAAYCLLVEEAFGQRPPFGILRYADATWSIRWDERLRVRLLATLEAMEADQAGEDVHRSHRQPGRCARCGQREQCDEALA